jgi:hypothetical protein
MRKKNFVLLGITMLSCGFHLSAEDTPIQKAMQYAHKAPKGETKIGEKIADGTASEAEIAKTLELYLAAADCKPPKGDPASFKDRWAKLVAATRLVAEKKPEGVAAYKDAVACKACHNEHKEQKNK